MLQFPEGFAVPIDLQANIRRDGEPSLVITWVRASLRQIAASILVFGAVFGAFGLEVAPPPTFAPNGFVFSKPFGAKVGGGRPPSPPFGAHIWRAFWRNSEQNFWRKQIIHQLSQPEIKAITAFLRAAADIAD